jgi:hypothetical protein
MTKFIDSQNLTSASIVKGLERGLGMNDTGTHDAIFEMAVAVGDAANQYLLRPTRNPDPTVYGSDPAMYGTKAPFPADASAAGIGTGAAADAVYANYKAAYVNWADKAYTTSPFPWTQLGYTYHWGQVDNVPVNLADVQGMSEFIMLGGTGGADSAKTPSGTDESGKLVTIGIYSPQSYIHTKNDGTSLSGAADAQYGNGFASFNVTGACDTLWAGASFQAGAHLDAASPNTIMIGAGGIFSGGQGVLVGSLNYTVSNAGSLAVNADMKKFNLAGSENIVLLFKGDSHDVPWQGNVKNILINSGAITAPTTNGTAVAAWAGDTEIINTGTITGTGSGYAIMTASGNDLISSNGKVTGGIHTLGGNDTVAVAGGSVSGEIDLGSDNADAFSASNTVFHVTIQRASGTVAPIRGMQIAKIADQGGIVIAVTVSETDIIKDKEIFPVVVVNPGGTLQADISRITILNDPALPMLRFSPQQADGALLLVAAYDGADVPGGDMAADIGALDRLGNPALEPADAGIAQAEGTAGFVVDHMKGAGD